MSTRNKSGFTLIELLIAVVISSILVTITVSIYTLFRRSLTLDQSRTSLNQNARVGLDRLSREVRQALAIVTVFPSGPNDNSVAEPNEIEFEDGHLQDGTYRRYYISGTTLQVDTKEYYLSGSPGTRVNYNTQPPGGQTLLSNVISTQTLAENVKSFVIYDSTVLQFILVTNDGSNQSFTLRTSIFPRNT